MQLYFPVLDQGEWIMGGSALTEMIQHVSFSRRICDCLQQQQPQAYINSLKSFKNEEGESVRSLFESQD